MLLRFQRAEFNSSSSQRKRSHKAVSVCIRTLESAVSLPTPGCYRSIMWFVPDAAVLFPYTIACLILFVTPGPDMSLFLARTLNSGVKAGIASSLGANAGCAVHTVLAALGISALVAASATAFLVLKIVGAVYLFYLAFDAIRNGSSLNVKGSGGVPIALWKSLVAGFAMNLTNPKVVLFYITFLPQFVAAADPHVTGKLLFLGLYQCAVGLPLSVGLILVAERFVRWLKSRPKVLRGIDFTFAGVFGIFAVKIALTEGRP
jgi:threonine/homoserine/homoserine lactone efflux protein